MSAGLKIDELDRKGEYLTPWSGCLSGLSVHKGVINGNPDKTIALAKAFFALNKDKGKDMSMAEVKNLISFVIPCYRSEATIEKVTDEIVETVAQRPQYDYEIICVNDGSPDNVYEVLRKLAAGNKKIKVVNLAKNMGKHAAVLAGYGFASGEYVVDLDDDYQSPTYELWKLLEPVERDECDYATAHYRVKKQAVWKNFGSNVNVLMGVMMLEKPKELRLENFSVMKRFVANEMIKYTSPYPYLEGLVLRVTRRIKMVEMEERERADNNQTGFTFKKSLSLWINGFTAFSVKPLRVSTFLGLVTAAIGFVAGVVMIIKRLMNPDMPMGYTSLAVIQLFLGGMILMCLGLVGEYIGRIYISQNKSPQYVVRNTINMAQTEEECARETSKV